MKYFDLKHVDYNMELGTQNGDTVACYHFKHLVNNNISQSETQQFTTDHLNLAKKHQNLH